MGRPIHDLTGQRFGHLTVLVQEGWWVQRKDGKPEGHRRACWRCRCDCGNESVVITNNLVSGNTRSCGCGRNREPARRAAEA